MDNQVTITKLFCVDEDDNYKAMEEVLFFLKICWSLTEKVKVNIKIVNTVKLLSPPIPTSDWGINITVSGSKESIQKVNLFSKADASDLEQYFLLSSIATD